MSTLKTNRIENNVGTAGFDVATIPDGGGFSMRNKLINGGFDVWQRGTSGFTTLYKADRWTTATINDTCSRDTDGSMKFVGHSTNSRLVQRIEGNKLNGKTVTLSLNTKSNTSTSVNVRVVNSNGALSSSMYTTAISTVYGAATLTFTVPTDGDGAYTEIRLYSSGGTDNYKYVQLEEGSVATPFEQRPIGMELALCQRYFEMTGATHPDTWTGDHYYDCIYRHSIGATTIIPGALYKVTKRVAPSVTIYNKYGVANAWHTNNVSRAVLGVGGGVDGFVRFVSATNASANNNNFFAFTADAEIY